VESISFLIETRNRTISWTKVKQSDIVITLRLVWRRREI